MFSRQAGNYLLGCCLVWLIPCQHVIAQDSGRPVISPIATLGKLAAALAIVLGIFWIFARVMRHVQSHQGVGLQQGLKVISSLSIGQRERVLIVQAGDEQLVLGVTGNQINTLHVLEKPLQDNPPIQDKNDFRQKLSAALKSRVDAQ